MSLDRELRVNWDVANVLVSTKRGVGASPLVDAIDVVAIYGSIAVHVISIVGLHRSVCLSVTRRNVLRRNEKLVFLLQHIRGIKESWK